MDALDKKLLALLDREGRITFSEMARALRHGRDIVEYRYRRAIESGLLKGVAPIIDPSALGLSAFKTYVRFVAPEDDRETLMKELRAHPNALCCALCHGPWDLVFNVAALSPHHFFQIRNEILKNSFGRIRDIAFSVITDMRHYLRKHLIVNPAPEWRIFAGEKRIDLNDVDNIIIQNLLQDGRMSLAEIARRTNSSEGMVRNRIQHFEETGLIAGYRGVLNREAFGLSGYKLQIELLDFSPTTMNTIFDFAKNEVSCYQAMVQLGSWPCELNVEVRDNRHLSDIIIRLREAFPKTIGRVEVLMYEHEEFMWRVGSSKRRTRATISNTIGSVL